MINQTTARASLSQILSTLFQKMENDPVRRGGWRGLGEGGREGGRGGKWLGDRGRGERKEGTEGEEERMKEGGNILMTCATI